jgi:hypothetical protein
MQEENVVPDTFYREPPNRAMNDDNPRKTDAELLGMLDEPGGWMVRARAAPAVPQGSLREALRQALDLSASGFSVMHIVKLPNDAIFLSATQVRRLWEALGMLTN